MTTEYQSIPSDEVLASQSDEFKAKVAARAEVLIAEEFALLDTRETQKVTQERKAEKAV